MSPERRTPLGVEFWDDNLGVKKQRHPHNYRFRDPSRYERVTVKIGGLERKATIVGDQETVLNHFGNPVPPKGSRLVVFDGDDHVTGVHETWLKTDN